MVTKGTLLRIAISGLPPLELPSGTATLTLTPLGTGGRGVLMVAGRETLRWTHVGRKLLPTARLGGLVSPKEWTWLGNEERGFGKGVVVEFGAAVAVGVTVDFAKGSVPNGTLVDWRARLPTITVCTVEARAVGWEAMPIPLGLKRGLGT